MALKETSPFARELRFVDHTRAEVFFGPRAPASLPEDMAAPDPRVLVTTATRLGLIAQDAYGDPSLWWVLADVNDVVDPFNLPVGEELRVPPLDRVLLEVLA